MANPQSINVLSLKETQLIEQLSQIHPYVIQKNDSAMIGGSQIPVRLVAQMYRNGDTVDDILQAYPHLNAAAVHDAISYYMDHRSEIEREISDNRIEKLFAETDATMDRKGFISFKRISNKEYTGLI